MAAKKKRKMHAIIHHPSYCTFTFALPCAGTLSSEELSSFTGASLSSLFPCLLPAFCSRDFEGALVTACVREVTIVYRIDPKNTMPAPAPSCEFQPLPNHHTLKQRLMALRVVSTMLVETEDIRCVSEAKSSINH